MKNSHFFSFFPSKTDNLTVSFTQTTFLKNMNEIIPSPNEEKKFKN